MEEDDDYTVKTDDEEDHDSYRKGGYHVVRVGDKYNDRYVIESKLGWGHFSTVWLASDSLVPDDHVHKLVAIKVQKSDTHYMEAALDEIDLLRDANKNKAANAGSEFVVQLLDHFFIHGPHGKHACLVFETMGKNTLSLIKKCEYRGVSPYIVKIMARQLLLGLDYLHSKCSIIHTDLKPENFLLLPADPFDYEQAVFHRKKLLQMQAAKKKASDLLASNPTLGMAPAFDEASLSKQHLQRLKKTDVLGASDVVYPSGYPLHSNKLKSDKNTVMPWTLRKAARASNLAKMPPIDRALAAYTIKISDLGNACWTHKHFTDDIATRQYRAPEVIVGMEYDSAVDIWAVACIVFELLTGDYLFDPKADAEGRHSRNEDHLALMKELLGNFPKRFFTGGVHSAELFSKKGEFHHIKDLQLWPLQDVLHEKYGLCKSESELISQQFLLPMLALDPMQRISAGECVKSPWLELSLPDIATMYRDFDCIESMHPEVALKGLELEIVRAAEVYQYVKATRFSETRLDRHLRRVCPYSTYLKDNNSTVAEEIARVTNLLTTMTAEEIALRPTLEQINQRMKSVTPQQASNMGMRDVTGVLMDEAKHALQEEQDQFSDHDDVGHDKDDTQQQQLDEGKEFELGTRDSVIDLENDVAALQIEGEQQQG